MPLDGSNYEQQDEVLDRLRRGRERVARPGGWMQGVWHGGRAQCAIGALFEGREVINISRLICRDSWLRLAIDLLEREVPDGKSIVAYNDAPGRTQAEIVALFDRAIAMMEGK